MLQAFLQTVNKLQRYFDFTQLKYNRPDLLRQLTDMAEGTESTQTMTPTDDTFHDVPENLSMWIRVIKCDGKSLPIGSFTERQIARIV